MEFRGSEELARGLMRRAGKDAVKQIVRRNMANMNNTTKDLMASTYIHTDRNGKPYSTGENARRTQFTISDGGLTGTQTTNTDHITYVEYGTRFMAAEPTIRPAFERSKRQFKQDLEGLVK